MPERSELANAIRALSMDAVQRANSGHPGMPMGMADIAEVLWNDFLRHNPSNPGWGNRDRFVLSNGHGSMLLYSLLHLTGYPLSIEEVQNFRQLGAKTPGHPEYDPEIGVETTTGPLGQGIANAVGFALAERQLAARFNQPGYPIVDHYTYVFAGDGCLMEGISHEACSLAGTLNLGKLVVFYDDNGISIDGETDGWFTDDTPARFRAYGWQVIPVVDGHDPVAIREAIERAREDDTRPTLICCKTIIGKGSPNKEGTAATHGAALGDEEVAAVRERIGWAHPPFEIPGDIKSAWDARESGEAVERAWNDLFARYAKAHQELALEYERRMAGDLPANWSEAVNAFMTGLENTAKDVATRKASQTSLNGFGPMLPELIGGSADLTGSNNTHWSGSVTITGNDNSNGDGNYIYFGVREFAMTAIANGLSLHGGFIPYTGTFLVFSDYARNAIRLASLMGVRNVMVYTHDSIGLGEDGPTHQPIEHLASLRAMPNLHVWRPCDAVETAAAWAAAIERKDGPACLALTRQKTKRQRRNERQLGDIRRGGYVLVEPADEPDIVLIATGSEVELATGAAAELAKAGTAVRVVSMPCADVFAAQDAAYRDDVLPPDLQRRIAIEAGATDGWYRWVGMQGRVIGIDRFGESAPASELFKHFGFTVDNVIKTARKLLEEDVHLVS